MAFVNIPGQSWRSPVATQADLPTAGNSLGDARVVQDTQEIFIWSGSAWVPVSGGGGSVAWGDITGTLSAQTDLQAALDAKAPATLEVQSYTGMIQDPEDETYTLDLYAAYDGTIDELKIITSTGTTVASVEINGTPVTGIDAVAVSSVIATGTASAANTFAAGDKITLTLSSSSSPADLAFTLKFTRS